MAEMALFKIPREEWIQIADTTLTEDVASLEFTTDINGNPFLCKRIICVVNFNGQLLDQKDAGELSVYIANQKIDRCGWLKLPRYVYGFSVESEVVIKGKILKSTGSMYSGGQLTDAYVIWHNGSTVAQYFSSYKVYSSNYYFPVDTNIRVWGLKA